jgi:hypothetical protein
MQSTEIGCVYTKNIFCVKEGIPSPEKDGTFYNKGEQAGPAKQKAVV